MRRTWASWGLAGQPIRNRGTAGRDAACSCRRFGTSLAASHSTVKALNHFSGFSVGVICGGSVDLIHMILNFLYDRRRLGPRVEAAELRKQDVRFAFVSGRPFGLTGMSNRGEFCQRIARPAASPWLRSSRRYVPYYAKHIDEQGSDFNSNSLPLQIELHQPCPSSREGTAFSRYYRLYLQPIQFDRARGLQCPKVSNQFSPSWFELYPPCSLRADFCCKPIKKNRNLISVNICLIAPRQHRLKRKWLVARLIKAGGFRSQRSRHFTPASLEQGHRVADTIKTVLINVGTRNRLSRCIGACLHWNASKLDWVYQDTAAQINVEAFPCWCESQPDVGDGVQIKLTGPLRPALLRQGSRGRQLQSAPG